MGLKHYGVLRGRVVGAKREDDADTPHYQVRVMAAGVDYRLAVNVKSQLSPSELLFLVDENFRHPLTEKLPALAEASAAFRGPGTVALDFIRGNLFNRLDMRLLPSSLPGPDNDLSDRLAHYVDRAKAEPDAVLYGFGERWGPERGNPDKIFQFEPGNGVHDIHMNQGNDPGHRGEDGVWQDGGLILRFPSTDQWVAIFLAFQSQAWHTDDETGHTLPGPLPGPGPTPHPSEPDFRVRIVAALVNPIGPAPEAETVTLLNATPDAIDLVGWSIIDKAERTQTLVGTIDAGSTRVVAIVPPVALGNKGGAITLVDGNGLKVDGVAYTKDDAAVEGWTIVF
ncbi:MAG: DUF2278 family protein [Burkholderiales bacterium]